MLYLTFFVKKQGSNPFSSIGRVKIFSSESRKIFVKKQPHLVYKCGDGQKRRYIVRIRKKAQKRPKNEPKTEKNMALNVFLFFSGHFLASVKNLCNGPPNYPPATFNKHLEGYPTVPSAVPYHRHGLYSWVRAPAGMN